MAKARIPDIILEKARKYKELIIKNNIPFREIYLFGSYAKGTYRKESDIDICVVTDKYKDSWDALGELNDVVFGHRDLYEIEAHGFRTKRFDDPKDSYIQHIRSYAVKI